MADLVRFEADFQSIVKSLREAAPEVARNMRRELTVIAKEIARDTRKELPSGMRSRGATGISWGFMGTRGAYVKAGGRGAPKSWAGALNGPIGNKTGFRHPVFPQAGSDRKKWNWGGAHGSPKQPNKPILEQTVEKRITWAVLKSEEAIQAALDEAFGEV